MRQHNLKVTGSLQINGENVISASELSTLSASINSKIEGLNPSQIGTGSYTASISSNGTFSVNTNTIITGSLSVSSLSGSGINYLAYSGGVVTAISGTAAIKYNQEFTATLGQTIFTPAIGYITDLIDVFYNGTKLSAETDYTASNGSTVILTQGVDKDGDIIEVAIYNPVSGVSNNTLRQQTTFTASVSQTTFSVNYTPGLIDVYFNGSHLANEEYTANNGTSIILSEAAAGGEIVDVFVYSYQVGAFSGIGGQGQAGQFAYFSSQNGISGSSIIAISGSDIIAGGDIIPSESGSYDLGSIEKPFRHIYVGTGSIYLVDNSGQVTNTISAQTIVTTDTLASGTIDLTDSLPTGTVSGSSQVIGILSSLNSFSASNDNTSLNAATSSYSKLTGGNTFTGTQIISASVYVQGDLVVQGSSSIQYISASSVSIGTNVVQLNTASPAVRYAGLTVQDSGSAQGVTGSMLWDSCCNRWIYSNPSGVGYSGGMLMSGPRASTLGSETSLTCNYIAKSGGGDHLYDSCIYESSGSVGIGTTIIDCYTGYSVLQVQGNSGAIIQTSDGCVKTALVSNCTGFGIVATRTNHGLKIYTNDIERLHITNTGISTFACQVCVSSLTSCGIITANNSGAGESILQSVMCYADGYRSTLRLNNAHTGGNIWELYSTNNTDGVYSGGKLGFRNATTDVYAMTITCRGNIGINTTMPVSTSLTGSITIYKSYNADQASVPSTIAQTYYGNQHSLYLFGRNSGLTIVSANSEEGSIKFANASTSTYATIGTTTGTSAVGGDMYFRVGSDTERLRITSTGIVCFTCQVCAPSGVKFGNGSSTINYYCAADWAPQFYAGGTTSFGLSSQTGTGRFTRIGNVVTLHGQISWTGAGSSGSLLSIQNLPWKAASNARAGISTGIISGIGDLCAGGLQGIVEVNTCIIYWVTHTNDGSGHIHLGGTAVKSTGSRLFSFAGSYITDDN